MLPTRSGEAAQSRQAMILYSAGVLPMSIFSTMDTCIMDIDMVPMLSKMKMILMFISKP